MAPRFPAIETLVPHRSPMLLLDSVEEYGNRAITCGLVLREDSTFVENGSVPSFVAIEYMAQCVAAYAGLGEIGKGKPVRIGYLIGARDVEFLVDAFHEGERLRVLAAHVWGDDQLGQFDCCVESNGRRCAQARLSVYQGDIGP